MRLIAVSMANNESDIVEAFVRHNLAFLDAMVVLDHCSEDATQQILRSLAAEGLPLTVLGDQDRAYHQSQRTTWLARRFARELDADFCFALDADEFLKVPSRAALEAALGALPAGACGLAPIQNYVGGDPASRDPNPVRRLTRRMREERGVSRKVVVPRAHALEESTQISMGNHAALRIRDGRIEPLPHALLPGVAIAHFPVRSAEQVAKKALVGWLAYRLTNPERFAHQGGNGARPVSHWQDLFQGLVAGQPIDASLVEKALAVYVGPAANGAAQPVSPDELVDDPLPTQAELRYAGLASPSPLGALGAWTERLVADINAGKLTPPA
jgi:glycosyl transferase family 2